METIEVAKILAELPFYVVLIIIVLILWKKIEALQAENRALMERLIAVSEENLHTSADNKTRLKRLERAELGKDYPTIPRTPLT